MFALNETTGMLTTTRPVVSILLQTFFQYCRFARLQLFSATLFSLKFAGFKFLGGSFLMNDGMEIDRQFLRSS